MPRATKSTQPEDPRLLYLAGVWDSTPGLRSSNTNNAAAISKQETWPKYMAKLYGGEARLFNSKSGDLFWGWYLTLEERVEIIDKVSPMLFTPIKEIDTARAKLEKAINNQMYKE